MGAEPKITRKRISDYRPQARNANRGSERGLQVIEDSLHLNGAGRSIVSDRDGEIIAGSQTIQAAENAGIREVIEVETSGDVLVVVKRADLDIDGLGEPAARAKALSIADNRSHELSYTQDDSVLAQLLTEIRNEDKALLKGALMSASELDVLLLQIGGAVADDAGAQVDRAEQLRVKWSTEPGQLWGIPSAHGGEHRLLCGDSLQKSSAELLCDDAAEYVLFCDPFFQDDVIKRLHDLYSFDVASFITGGTQLQDVLKHVGHFHEVVILGLSAIPQMGNTHKLFYEHKVCLWVSPSPLNFGIGFSSVIRSEEGATRQVGDVYHHTSKPVDVCEALIRPHRQKVVIDTFAGAGSTLIACERLRRHWRGCEIDPAFVAAILERAALIGLAPRLLKHV